MRLPIPLLLYITALSLFGCAGWIVYSSLDLWTAKTQNAASKKGHDDALRFIANGKGKGPQSSSWNYAAAAWWPQVKEVNLIGKLPEKKPTPEELAAASKPVEVVVDVTPLEDIFELVSLVYDGKGGGKGENSHVIIRYKLEAGVEPPEWWVRENTPAASSGGGMRGPRDLAAAPATATTNRSGRGRGGRGNQARPRPRPTAMPTSVTGREILQKIWADDDGNPRRSSKLWGKYSHIRLVRVDSSAESAFFSRTPPANEGEPGVAAKEEELLKTSAEIPQDVLLALRRLQGRESGADGGSGAA